jgi:hypothetical protein
MPPRIPSRFSFNTDLTSSVNAPLINKIIIACYVYVLIIYVFNLKKKHKLTNKTNM